MSTASQSPLGLDRALRHAPSRQASRAASEFAQGLTVQPSGISASMTPKGESAAQRLSMLLPAVTEKAKLLPFIGSKPNGERQAAACPLSGKLLDASRVGPQHAHLLATF